MSKDCSSVPWEIITNHFRCMKYFPSTRYYGTVCLSHCIWQSAYDITVMNDLLEQI